MQVTRERNAILTVLKDTKRQELQTLCRTHDIKGLTRPRNLLEAALAEHCVAEHSGRVLNLGKCEKSVLNASATAAKPLGQTKRTLAAPPPAASVASGRSASQTANEASPSSAILQELLERLDSVSKSSLTAAQIEEIVENKIASRLQSVQDQLAELQTFCESTSANIAGAFESVDAWKEEVTSSFDAIQAWARDIEQQILSSSSSRADAGMASTSVQSVASVSRKRSSIFSSTPAPGPASASMSGQVTHMQTPLLAMHTPSFPTIHKRIRLSDASELSLATIPEQVAAASPLQQRSSASQSPVDKAVLHHDDQEEDGMVANETAAHHAFTSPCASPQPAAELPEEHETALAEETAADDAVNASIEEPAVHPEALPSRTPAAARTLFGTERSLDSRFGDAMSTEQGQEDSPAPLAVFAARPVAWSLQ